MACLFLERTVKIFNCLRKGAQSSRPDMNLRRRKMKHRTIFRIILAEWTQNHKLLWKQNKRKAILPAPAETLIQNAKFTKYNLPSAAQWEKGKITIQSAYSLLVSVRNYSATGPSEIKLVFSIWTLAHSIFSFFCQIEHRFSLCVASKFGRCVISINRLAGWTHTQTGKKTEHRPHKLRPNCTQTRYSQTLSTVVAAVLPLKESTRKSLLSSSVSVLLLPLRSYRTVGCRVA